jgi:hypothetical protein
MCSGGKVASGTGGSGAAVTPASTASAPATAFPADRI